MHKTIIALAVGALLAGTAQAEGGSFEPRSFEPRVPQFAPDSPYADRIGTPSEAAEPPAAPAAADPAPAITAPVEAPAPVIAAPVEAPAPVIAAPIEASAPVIAADTTPPAPVVTPVPVTEPPTPVAQTPTPLAQTPAPVAQTPAPVAQTPAEIIVSAFEPAPAVEAPDVTPAAPASVIAAPAAPAPVAVAPAPAPGPASASAPQPAPVTSAATPPARLPASGPLGPRADLPAVPAIAPRARPAPLVVAQANVAQPPSGVPRAAPRAAAPAPRTVDVPRVVDAPRPVPDAVRAEAVAAGDMARVAPPAVLVPSDPAAPLRGEAQAPLDRNAREAVRQSRDFVNRDNLPTNGEEGRVVYNFGAGMPTVVCAPVRICTIDLQPGERVVGALHAGDTVRWLITPAESGNGRHVVTHIVVKPKEAGLETNLMIPTDRRVYHMRLVSRTADYVARVAFAYPDDTRQAWEAYQARNAELQKTVVADLPPTTVDKLNFDYTTEGVEKLMPVRVFDDGEKTYIQLPIEMRHREAPAVVLLNRDGGEQIVNYRKREDFYVIDRLFDKAALILGVGRNQERVTITRMEKGGRSQRAWWWPFHGTSNAQTAQAPDPGVQ